MHMDMQDGSSSSFQYRGRGGRSDSFRGGGGYRGGYYGGRDGARGRGSGRGSYDQYDNTYRPPGVRHDNEGYHNGGNYDRGGGFGGNSSYDRGGYRGGGGGGGRQQQQQHQPRNRDRSWGNNTRGGGGNRGGSYNRGAPRGGGRQQQQQLRPPAKPYADQPKDVEFVTMLKGHTDGITTVAYDAGSAQLYTGSKDESVRVWDTASGKCTSSVQVGGRVDSLLLQGGFLFVGLHVAGVNPPPGLIKVWNLGNGQQHDLAGHTDEILALAAAGNCLFSGGKDMSIRAWQFDPSAGTFAPSAVITAAQGGHGMPVQALLPLGLWLLSADWGGSIKVWDMASGACVQTLAGAHEEAVMGLLAWENVVVSCSLDGRIKVWQPVEAATCGAVLDASPVYVHPPEEPGHPPEQWGGVLAVAGAIDGQQRPLLLSSYNDDSCVRMWDLPSFAERGSLPAVRDARALAAVPGGILVAGDKMGTVKVWRWRPMPMPVA